MNSFPAVMCASTASESVQGPEGMTALSEPVGVIFVAEVVKVGVEDEGEGEGEDEFVCAVVGLRGGNVRAAGVSTGVDLSTGCEKVGSFGVCSIFLGEKAEASKPKMKSVICRIFLHINAALPSLFFHTSSFSFLLCQLFLLLCFSLSNSLSHRFFLLER